MAVNMQQLEREHALRGTEIAKLKFAMVKLVAFVDSVLPQVGKLCFDIGNLNEALILARPLIGESPIKEKHTPREIVEQCKLRWEISLEDLADMDCLSLHDETTTGKEMEELTQWIAAAVCILEEFRLKGA